VPGYAVVPESHLTAIENELGRDDDGTRTELDAAFRRFEETQPHVAERMAEALRKPIDETALSLGYFLSIAVWMAFDRAFGERLVLVTEDALRATEAAMALEEELRAAHSDEPIELDDVVAMEQPHVVAFANEHVDAALDPDADGSEVDIDDVHRVYRATLILTVALSYAVMPERGTRRTEELLA
jgi:hypothetical protein